MNENGRGLLAPKTPSERKSIYLKLLNKCEDLEEKNSVNLEAVKEVGAVLKEANRLQTEVPIEERVHHTDETFLDCKVVRSAGAIAVKCIQAVDINVASYDPTEFCKTLQNYVSDDGKEYGPENLLKLLDFTQSLIPPLPSDRGLYGMVDFVNTRIPKEKKKKEIVKKVNAAKKKPEVVDVLENGEEKIYKIVKEMSKILIEEYNKNGQQPIDYYNYVIDTSDFGATIENIFYTSFLVREGKASIDLTGPNCTTAVLRPIKKDEFQAYKETGGTYAQVITSISMDEWKKFKNEGLLQKRRNLKR